jgi:hypothetical protein
MPVMIGVAYHVAVRVGDRWVPDRLGELCILEGVVFGADFVLAGESRYAPNDLADRDRASRHLCAKTDSDPDAGGRRDARV